MTNTPDTPPVAPPTRAWDKLSARQAEVAVRLARGRTNREIAEELGITTPTVDTHRAAVLDRLGIRNNADLARLAIREGVITAEV